MAGGGSNRQFVWDWPTRLFHWLLVVLFGVSWWSAENNAMDWHYRSGLTLLALIVFRLLWGFMGTSTARFSQFVKGPGTVWAYLRGRQSESGAAAPGHNPLGGWSVIVMLVLIAMQVLAGLFAVDTDGLESGPLSYLVSFDQGRTAAEIHEIGFTLLQIVIALHVLAVLFYLIFKRRNLTGTMITGRRASAAQGAPSARAAPIWRLAVAILVAAAITYAVANGLRFS